jgi:two-component system, chemotaxis family, protein-glutamate methylesterase/glutaminase
MATRKIATRDIIVVGASAGGITALVELLRSIPDNFKATIFVVLHLPPSSPSALPAILTRAGVLKAQHPVDGERVKAGMIYVATPDHHMLLEDNRVLVKKGPKENNFRPSIDALFRSAAYEYGPRVIGIVLSGLLNDGTSGLWTVKRLGGTTIIQDPTDADFPSMPLNVLNYVKVDHAISASAIGPLLQKLTKERAAKQPKISKEELEFLKMEVIISKQDNAFAMGIMNEGDLTAFTCPECNGVLVRLIEGKFIRFRCHTGHAYTASSLLADLSKSVEETLWQAMRGLEETTLLLNQISEHFKTQDLKEAARIFAAKADMTTKRARVIHDSVFTQEILSEDLRHTTTKKRTKKVSKKK